MAKLLHRFKTKHTTTQAKAPAVNRQHHELKPEPSQSSESALKQSDAIEFVGHLGNRVSKALLVQRQEGAGMLSGPAATTSMKSGSGQSVNDPRRQMAQKIVDKSRSGGITVAVYVTDTKPSGAKVKGAAEFKGQAVQYAVDHVAVGLSGDSIQEGTAMELTNGLPNTLQTLQIGIQTLLEDYPELTDYRSELVPIRRLAIFTHGTRTGLQAGAHARWIKNELASWVQGIAPFLSTTPQILLYACSAAGQPATGLPFAHELQLALQQELTDLHGEDVDVAPEVWGHTTAGHTTANKNLVGTSGSDGAVAKEDLLSELSTKLTTLYLERAEHGATLSDAMRAKIHAISQRMIRQTMSATTGRRSPTNVYMREIPQLGIDRVWQQLISKETPDVSDLELSSEAAGRLIEGLAEFRERLKANVSMLEKVGGPMKPSLN